MNITELFNIFPEGIRVPRIQRGYVQGRDDSKGRELQKEFVPKLVNAVLGGQTISFDFLYNVNDYPWRSCENVPIWIKKGNEYIEQ